MSVNAKNINLVAAAAAEFLTAGLSLEEMKELLVLLSAIEHAVRSIVALAVVEKK
ncbi:MAG TPA: hypothetical protein P5161_01735 [Eubacteriales bacterium]|nr:hypothetical protein [Clostridia bacterium]HRR89485.1 hypothetical protein [Eubacteriales bacterium]